MISRKAICCLLLWLAYAITPSGSFAQEAKDNPSVTGQLTDAKAIVAKIKKDAAEMEGFARAGGPSWDTHAATLTRIKEDVNKLQENMRGLQSHRTVASPWQQDAIDRVTGLVNDLASNMNAAITQLNKSKARPTAPPYPEYLKTNAQLARDLADEIDDIIDYGQNKAKLDALQKQLPQ
jgi:hypothetical protein